MKETTPIRFQNMNESFSQAPDVPLGSSSGQVIREFLLKSDPFQEMTPWVRRVNIFDVLGVADLEIRHSNMLAWLLNPDGSHGLGDAFLRGFIREIRRFAEANGDCLHSLKWLTLDTTSVQVLRESKHLDILLLFPGQRSLIAIENKVSSKQGKDQLSRYREALRKRYPRHAKCHVYLTPEGVEEPNDEHWISLTYHEVLSILTSMQIESRQGIPDEVRLIVQNYIQILKTGVIMDEGLIKICRKIYTENRSALDLIFEFGRDGDAEVVRNALSELSKANNDIIIGEKSEGFLPFSFHTKWLDDFIQPIPQGATSSWGTSQAYYFRIYIREQDIVMALEFSGNGISKEQRNKIVEIAQQLKDAEKSRAKIRTSFVFYRVRSEKFPIPQDEGDYSAALKTEILKFVNSIKKTISI